MGGGSRRRGRKESSRSASGDSASDKPSGGKNSTAKAGREKKAAKEDASADDAPPDAPGRYKIIAPSAVAVSSTVTLGGERVGVLEPGNTFTISSIKEASDRIRGRIEEP